MASRLTFEFLRQLLEGLFADVVDHRLLSLTHQLSHAELEMFDWKADIIEALDVASG